MEKKRRREKKNTTFVLLLVGVTQTCKDGGDWSASPVVPVSVSQSRNSCTGAAEVNKKVTRNDSSKLFDKGNDDDDDSSAKKNDKSRE